MSEALDQYIEDVNGKKIYVDFMAKEGRKAGEAAAETINFLTNGRNIYVDITPSRYDAAKKEMAENPGMSRYNRETRATPSQIDKLLEDLRKARRSNDGQAVYIPEGVTVEVTDSKLVIKESE